MSIYHWNLGDIALARICKKVYAKVKVVKNEDGLFYDDKILAMRTSDDNPEPIEELCYYVEIIRSGDQLWLPYTCLHLAERSRPFYGNDKQSPTKPGTSATATTPKKNPTSPTNQPVTIHVSFCLVCGNGGRLRECARCPAAFHPACRREWLTTIIHRKKPPQHNQTVPVFVERILSSTRALTVDAAPGVAADPALCPSCMWGPKVGYDDVVWHKLGPCAWWPARVLPPGGAPAKLLARAHHKRQWALRYYGTLNYAWGEATRMCLFLPRHTTGMIPRDPVLQQAMLDASDDYITVYLT